MNANYEEPTNTVSYIMEGLQMNVLGFIDSGICPSVEGRAMNPTTAPGCELLKTG